MPEKPTVRFEINVHEEEGCLALEMRCRLSPQEAVHLARSLTQAAQKLVVKAPIVIPPGSLS